MRRSQLGYLMMIGLAGAAARGHDMFLVVPDHDLPAGATSTVALYNGTFETSENPIDRDRMADVTVVDGQGSVTHPPADRWRDEGNVSLLELRPGAPGTHLLGVSTRPRMIELSAGEFNDYLEHDGVLDVLEERRRSGAISGNVRERYSKHVKTILQVGDTPTETFSQRLGYPVEIVPLANPGTVRVGDALDVLVLAEGEAAPEQLVYASYAGFQSSEPEGGHREVVQTRTDEDGVARIPISRPGRWYIRLIRMLPVSEAGADYESLWATLTFEVP